MARRKTSRLHEDSTLAAMLEEATRGHVLTREEELDLFQRLEADDDDAREEIVRCNLRFVIKIAMQYKGMGVPLADLVQEGSIGLLHVIGKFDWRRGTRFTTYAAYYIRQEVQACVYRQSSMIRLPVRKARVLGRIQEVIRKTQEREGREPQVAEIALILGEEQDTIEMLMGLRHSFASIDAEQDEDGHSMVEALQDMQAVNPGDALNGEQSRAAVIGILDVLSEREREVLNLRFGLGSGHSRSLRKASAVIGLSQEGVRRVENRALDKLRRPTVRARFEQLMIA
jgi:RNA polymerase primary sigma factor